VLPIPAFVPSSRPSSTLGPSSPHDGVVHRAVGASRRPASGRVTNSLSSTFLFAAAVLLTACGRLSSAEATRLVTAMEQFHRMPTEPFYELAVQSPDQPLPAALRDVGLIDIKREWIRQGFASHYENRAHLTSAGRTRMAAWKGAYNYAIPMATKRRIVKASVANLTNATAEANVVWVFELNDIGEQLARHGYQWGGEKLDAQHAFTARFKKYDDGWRVEELTSGVL